MYQLPLRYRFLLKHLAQDDVLLFIRSM